MLSEIKLEIEREDLDKAGGFDRDQKTAENQLQESTASNRSLSCGL